MRPFLFNIMLAFIWAFSVGDFTMSNVTFGFVLGFLSMWLGKDLFETAEYSRKVPQLFGFIVFFLWEMIRANLRVAYDVVTPTHYMTPGIMALPLDAKTDVEITFLANLLTLTPGTLSLEVSEDRKWLYLHAMYLDDMDRERQRIKSGLERRLLELMR